MKICLINNLYKPFNRGGAEQIVELILSGLAKKGHDVFVIATKPYKKKQSGREARAYYINSLYYSLNKAPKALRLFWHFFDMFDLGCYLRLKSILKKEKPDLVMTHNLKGVSYLVPRLIKNLKIKHVHTLHDVQLLHPSGLMIYGQEKTIEGVWARIYQYLCRILFDSPEIVISPSSWLLKEHENKNFFTYSKKHILANPSSFAPHKILKALNKKNNKFRFLYIGQIEEHKGILFLIKAFRNISKPPDGFKGHWAAKIKLIIAGDGTKIKQARKLARDDKNIHFLGKVKHSDLMMQLGQFNALVIPSFCYENSPAVIYEALSAGLPVIASRIGGIAELIYSTAGVLFKPKNSEDLMRQMKWAIGHKKELEKISLKGKIRAEQYKLDNYIIKLLDLLR